MEKTYGVTLSFFIGRHGNNTRGKTIFLLVIMEKNTRGKSSFLLVVMEKNIRGNNNIKATQTCIKEQSVCTSGPPHGGSRGSFTTALEADLLNAAP